MPNGHPGTELRSTMPAHTRAGNVSDEGIGLISASPTLPTPSTKSAFSTLQPVSPPRTHIRKTSDVVTWGINWKQPALIIAFAFCGLVSAIGHHLYYHFINNTLVSSPEAQQWALRFGTAFSVFTITMLRAAVVAAYNQYIWKVFRKRSFSVADLNKIFSLTSDFTGFFSLTLFKYGRLVILLASLCWLLPLAGLAPAATLSVVTSLHTEVMNQSLPTLNFSSAQWQNIMFPELSIELVTLASTINAEQTLPQLTAPAPNSSYTVHFYGPTIQCDEANSSEQAAFDRYNIALWTESKMLTSLTLQMLNDGELGFPNGSNITEVSCAVLMMFVPGSDAEPYSGQLWIQTANNSIVCSPMNASFEVGIEYLDGVQTISQRNTEVTRLETQSLQGGYPAIFNAVSDILVGNTSARPGAVFESNIALRTGLVTCEEIFWWLNPDNYNDTMFGSSLTNEVSEITLNLPAEYSLCRNRTISLAIQDLANNFTISLLSNPNMTVNISTPVAITTPQNIYQYDSRNLILSYASGIAATIFAVIVGLMAINSNGVCHSTSFSAIMTSTVGNHDMSEVSRGQSLGAEPLSRTVAEKKLRLGVIKVADAEAEKDEWGDTMNRVGFGLEGTVMKLMKEVKSL